MRAIVILFALALASPLWADFSAPVLESVSSLQEKIITQSRRDITGADIAAMWGVFDADVLRALNGGVVPLTIKNLNKKYGWTDISIEEINRGTTKTIKTGEIRILFFPIRGKDLLAVYYQGLGVVPASTFHVFHYSDGHYELAEKMEDTHFLNKHPHLQWNALHVVLEPKEKYRYFLTLFVPVKRTDKTNRSQALWDWNGKRLRTLNWTPQVDYHEKKDGSIVSGPGPTFKVKPN